MLTKLSITETATLIYRILQPYAKV